LCAVHVKYSVMCFVVFCREKDTRRAVSSCCSPCNLVPEHVETHPLYNHDKPGIEQVNTTQEYFLRKKTSFLSHIIPHQWFVTRFKITDSPSVIVSYSFNDSIFNESAIQCILWGTKVCAQIDWCLLRLLKYLQTATVISLNIWCTVTVLSKR
jgi:hypothetical protein